MRAGQNVDVDGSGIRYTRSGHVDIAWTVTGQGPIDIVYVAGFVSHLDMARELPVYGTALGRLDRIERVLAFLRPVARQSRSAAHAVHLAGAEVGLVIWNTGRAAAGGVPGDWVRHRD